MFSFPNRSDAKIYIVSYVLYLQYIYSSKYHSRISFIFLICILQTLKKFKKKLKRCMYACIVYCKVYTWAQLCIPADNTLLHRISCPVNLQYAGLRRRVLPLKGSDGGHGIPLMCYGGYLQLSLMQQLPYLACPYMS